MKLNRNTLIKTGLFAFISTALIVTACNKSSSSSGSASNEGDAASLSTSSEVSDNAYNDAFGVIMQTGNSTSNGAVTVASVDGNNSNTGILSGDGLACASVTVSPADSNTFPKTITVDFGTGCTSLTGTVRKGSITYILSGHLLYPGTTVSATFNGYSVNGYRIAGTYTIANNSTDAGLSFTRTVEGGQVTLPDSSYYSYSGTKTITQTAGFGTTTLLDDVYNITGSHNFASSASGKSLVDSIATPLVLEGTCSNIVSGIINFTFSEPNVSLKGTFDYGSGDCDKSATIKVGNTTRPVTLP